MQHVELRFRLTDLAASQRPSVCQHAGRLHCLDELDGGRSSVSQHVEPLTRASWTESKVDVHSPSRSSCLVPGSAWLQQGTNVIPVHLSILDSTTASIMCQAGGSVGTGYGWLEHMMFSRGAAAPMASDVMYDLR